MLSALPTNRRGLAISALKLSVALVVGFYLYQQIASAVSRLQADESFQWHDVHWAWLGLGGLFYLIGMLPMAWYWHRLLLVFDQSPTLFETMRAYFLGHLGKYVPGKALVVVIRAATLQSANVASRTAVVTVFAETLTMMSSGAFVAGGIIAVVYREHVVLLIISLALLLVAGLPTYPPVFRFLVQRSGIARSDRQLENLLRKYTHRIVLQGWVANLVGWSLLGLSLLAVLKALPVTQFAQSWYSLWPGMTATVALAVVAGFISLLPGGMFVRELVIDQLLRPSVGSTAAILAAVALRLVWLLAELLTSIILYGWWRYRSELKRDRVSDRRK